MGKKFKRDNFNRPESKPENYKWAIFYFNPDDSRVIVPRRAKMMGWTLNFGNLWSYVIIALFIVLALAIGLFKR